MPRNLLNRWLPKPDEVRREKSLQMFGKLLHSSNLWHLNRYSVSGAISIGLFVCFMPVPIQMLLAGAAAIAFGCNLPLSIITVWVSNPLTYPVLFYAAYLTGAWLLGHPAAPVTFEISFAWLRTTLQEIWEPFLLGCVVLGLASAVVGNVAVRIAWRLHVARSWRQRQERHRARRRTVEQSNHSVAAAASNPAAGRNPE